MRFFRLAGFRFRSMLTRGVTRKTHVTQDSYMRFTNGLFARPSASVIAFMAVSCSLVFSVFSSRAQEGLNPSDIWYRGFLLVQSAQELEAQGKFLDALNKLTEAKPLYDHLAQQFPDFQPEIVKERRHLIAEKRDELKSSMRAPQAPAGAPAPAFLPQPQPLPQSPSPEMASGPALPEEGHSYSSRTRDMEVEESDGEFALPSWNDGASQALPRVSSVPGMPRVETRHSSPSVGAIANSLHEDLSRKDSLISWLNDENQKLRRDLQQQEQQRQQIAAELGKAQASREELMRQISTYQGGPGGAEALQKVSQLEVLLRDATQQLQTALDRNEQLVAAMEDREAEMGKMRDRIAELENERENLAEVVRGEGNGGTALKELMDRNRKLTEQLDRAEQLASSLSELNKEKDDDIALLKSEITRIKVERDQLLSENARHQQSIEELQEKLELLSDGLTAEDKQALASANPVERQENELLRSIVLKQLRRQAQMKQAKELLLKQLDKVGARSDELMSLVEDMVRGSQLSEEEKSLFKAPQFAEIIEASAASVSMPGAVAEADPVVETPAAETGAPVMSATLVAAGTAPAPGGPDGVVQNQKLTVELSQIDKAARLDFKEGRFSEAEAGFLDYLRYLPRNVPCLCNLGVLKISMKNYSEAEYYLEKALAIDSTSGLANYLLGRTYFLQDKIDEALSKLETGLTYDPQNAKAHNCVGVISTRKGWVSRAERAFTNAVSIDPDYGDAHFNLAVLHATKDEPNPKEAEKHYFRALHLGVPRDASIEGFLKEYEEAGVSVGMR
jgi:Tfp pilus assembly protein PilF